MALSGEITNVAHEVEQERRVTWLELFYDLVYVATIIQLGNVLSDHVSLVGFFEFAALFLPVWWSWMGVTFYATRFLEDDTRHRLLIFVQMFAVAVLAINIPTAFEAQISGFALGYVGVRLVLVALFLGVKNPARQARTLARHYAIGFSFSAMLWLVAAFVPMPLRYALWITAMGVDFLVPLNPATRPHANRLPPAREHIIERFALFTMIVLGESFVKVIGSLAGDPLKLGTLVFGIMGLVIACSLWWLYFDRVPTSTIKPSKVYTWIYAHLPLVIGITSVAVAIYKVVQLDLTGTLAAPYRWLLCTTVAICLVSVALINSASEHANDTIDYLLLSRVQAVAAASVLLLGVLAGIFPTTFPPTVLVGLIAVLCVSQVIVSRQFKVGHTLAASVEHGSQGI